MEDLSRAIESAEGSFPDDFYASVKVEVMKAFGLLLGEMPDRFDQVIGLNTSVRPLDARRMARAWSLMERNCDLRRLGFQQPRELISLVKTFDEAGLGWRLDGLAADDLRMAVLVQLSPRKRLKVS